MQLNEPELKRMTNINFQTMRKLLNWDITYINRDNTNENILLEINNKLKETTDKDNKKRKKTKQES